MSIDPVESCLQLLQAMVGFDTVNANISGKADAERPLAEYLRCQAEGMGFATRQCPVSGGSFDLLISHQVSDDAPWLMFASHLDTVSVEGMTIEPFRARIDRGRIYGRGACDTKSSGAAMLWALRQYACGGSRPNNVALLYTIDEEIGKTGAKAFAERHLPDLDRRPAGVIVGEPTLLRPIIAHNGIVRWSVRTRGRAAHSLDPSKGLSAISMMVKVVAAMESRYIPALSAVHPLTGKAQCSINIIRGGVQVNIIPESCVIQIDRRVVPGEDPEGVLPAVEALLDELRREDPALEVVQERPFVDPPLDPKSNEAFARFVLAGLGEMGMAAEAGGVGYSTDASNLGAAGLPAVVLGPGDIAQAHTCDEWLALDQLEKAVEVYLGLMRRPLTG